MSTPKFGPKQLQPDLPKLIRMIPNKFLLAIAVAKRAKQLKEGVKPMIEVDANAADYPIDIAMKEVEEGKVRIVVKDKPIDDEHILVEMDQLLDKELAVTAVDDGAEKKLVVKEKGKPKSKSLAA